MRHHATNGKASTPPQVKNIASAYFFTIKPISTRLQNKSAVPLCYYTTGKGLDCANPRLMHFDAIDLDSWAEDCLNAMDVFFDPRFLEGIDLFHQFKTQEQKAFLSAQGIVANSFFEAIFNARTSLANTISDLVEPILNSPATGANMLKEAKARYKQQLQLKLGSSYFIDTLVQAEVSLSVEASSSPEKLLPPAISVANANGGEVSGTVIRQQKDADTSLYDLSFFLAGHHKTANSFVPVVIGNKAEKIEVPIDLRTYPPMPAMGTQSGTVAAGNLSTDLEKLENALTWDYAYTYSLNQAAQDQIFFRVELNPTAPPSPFSGSTIATQKLFDDLAQFVSVKDAVITDLINAVEAIDPETPVTDPNVDKAYFTMAALVQLSHNLADSWANYSPLDEKPAQTQASGSFCDFIMTQGPDPDFVTTDHADHGQLPRLLVTLVPKTEFSALDNTLYPSADLSPVALPSIPLVDIEGYARENATDRHGASIPGSYWYATMNDGKKQYLSFNEVHRIAQYTVTIKGLSLLQAQSVRSAIAIIRNEHLVASSNTASSLIYHSLLISFADSYLASFTNGTEIDISRLKNEAGKSLRIAAHLANLFEIVLRNSVSNQQDIKLSIAYFHPITADLDQAVPSAEIPVMLSRSLTLNIPADYQIPAGGCDAHDAGTSLVCDIAKGLKAWYVNNQPPTDNAFFKIDLTLFAKDQPASALVALTNLTLPVAAINDL